MNQEVFKEQIALAEAAFASKQYAVSLYYFMKALEEDPDDVYALSRAGSIALVIERYADADHFFSHAVEVDPDNGDNYYNLGNACFFRKDYKRCVELFAKAEEVGCSDEVKQKLCFQRAMLCKQNGDMKSALVYLDKYEKSLGDPTKIDPRIIRERALIYVILGNRSEALRNAKMLLDVQPTVTENYILTSALLVDQEKYSEAELILRDAEKYAVSNADEKYAVKAQLAALYAAIAVIFIDDKDSYSEYYGMAMDIYEGMLDDPELSEKYDEVMLSIADLQIKSNDFASAIKLLEKILPRDDDDLPDTSIVEPVEPVVFDLSDVEDEDYEVETDEDDDEVEDEDDDEVEDDDDDEVEDEDDEDDEDDDDDDDEDEDDDEDDAEEDKPVKTLSSEMYEQAKYLMMVCYVSLEDYASAGKIASEMLDSSNNIYKYFSIYCDAYSTRMLAKDSEAARQKYEKAIAYFRSRMMNDPRDHYAAVLRARMYAEQGSYYKAEEMVKIFPAEEKEAMMRYIDECRNSQKG